MPLVIRPASPDELDAVGALTLQAYAVDGFITAEHPYAASLLDTIARSRDAELLVGLDDEGTLLGTVTYVLPGTPFAEVGAADEAEVRMLAVAPAARGRGVGELLTRECVQRARAGGLAGVALASASVMASAHRLYGRMGFERMPERDWSPREGIDLLAYRLRF